MALVMVADDAYFFMVAWETMALSSFFLITCDHDQAEIRRAGYLYLLIAHLGAISILLSFGALQAGTGDYTFEHMRALQPSAGWATAAFLLALLGFGAKAGIVPLHVWLPEAHPAAPSPVSALLSAAMLKTAVYGLLRVTLDLIGSPLWWWGVLALALGLVSALGVIFFAAVQTDMKRLLAYSSIENIGLIFAGFGLTLIFHGFGMGALAALALTATLYHCLNHAFYKCLLFLCTGSVLHATRERSLGPLGGLILRIPLVACCPLIGSIGIDCPPPSHVFDSDQSGATRGAGRFVLPSSCPEGERFSPPCGCAVTLCVVSVAWRGGRLFYHGAARRSAPWDCGFPDQNARMQDSAEGFGQPVRVV